MTQPDAIVGARRWIGIALAIVLSVVTYLLLPERIDGAAELHALSHTARAVAGIGVAMATLWITEALPIPVTALLPIVLFPLLTGGSVGIKQATAPFGHEVIFLFLGGFILAQAVQRWGLHRRFALHTILLVGSHPRRLVGGFMAASAFLSMWISNTATTVMMLPVALSVVELMRASVAGNPKDDVAVDRFATCLLLGIAYAASIGGMGTLIGTAPNALFAAFMQEEYGVEISFVRWMTVGVPLVCVFLPITWFVLTRIVFRVRLPGVVEQRSPIRAELDRLGPVTPAERRVLAVFLLTAGLWITRPILASISLTDGWRPLVGLTDSGIAIAASVLLFTIPVRDGGRLVSLLTWQDAVALPWGVLILFGGGLSLASAIQHTGVAAFIGGGVSAWHAMPAWVIVLAVTATIVFLTELTSNTATTATFLPILGAAAVGMSLDPLMLTVPAALAASCAFMMPVATPPNAIVFSSGYITVPQMCKAGLWLNGIGVVLIVLLMYSVAVPQVGIALPG